MKKENRSTDRPQVIVDEIVLHNLKKKCIGTDFQEQVRCVTIKK